MSTENIHVDVYVRAYTDVDARAYAHICRAYILPCYIYICEFLTIYLLYLKHQMQINIVWFKIKLKFFFVCTYYVEMSENLIK